MNFIVADLWFVWLFVSVACLAMTMDTLRREKRVTRTAIFFTAFFVFFQFLFWASFALNAINP